MRYPPPRDVAPLYYTSGFTVPRRQPLRSPRRAFASENINTIDINRLAGRPTKKKKRKERKKSFDSLRFSSAHEHDVLFVHVDGLDVSIRFFLTHLMYKFYFILFNHHTLEPGIQHDAGSSTVFMRRLSKYNSFKYFSTRIVQNECQR